jgi:GNAT superfamily N-acetyltransferase
VRVEKIDANEAPEELLRELHACEVDAKAESRPGEPPLPFDQFLGYLRHPGDGSRHYWLVRDADGVVGSASLAVHGPALAYAEVLVRPPSRRRGIGTALLEQLLPPARADGARSLLGHHSSQAGAAFARKAGARDDQRDVRARLDLGAAELPEAVAPAGVELRSWVGRTPDGLLETHVAARQAMDDAPMPEGTEHPAWTVERHLRMEDSCIARGRPPRVTAALEDGEIVAFTDLRVGEPPCPVALTDDTGTLARARRRGLATAVKREALRRLRDERPDVQYVTTFNAEGNVAMRAVNAKLGFVPVTIFTSAVLEL